MERRPVSSGNAFRSVAWGLCILSGIVMITWRWLIE